MNEKASLLEIAAVTKTMLVECGFPKMEKCGAKRGGVQLEEHNLHMEEEDAILFSRKLPVRDWSDTLIFLFFFLLHLHCFVM